MPLSLDDLYDILKQRAYEKSERDNLLEQLATADRNVKRLNDEIAVRDAEIARLEARAEKGK
jgi:uncharacterized small protein (DUF1192 family)